jgi:hypothetical protein
VAGIDWRDEGFVIEDLSGRCQASSRRLAPKMASSAGEGVKVDGFAFAQPTFHLFELDLDRRSAAGETDLRLG